LPTASATHAARSVFPSSICRDKVDKPGSVAVPARDLFDRVKMMPDGQVSMSIGDNAAMLLRAVGSARRYTLHGLPGDDFPSLPNPEAGSTEFELKAEALSKLIAATHFSISTDETRLHLNSALFEWEGDRVRMVTTDGHRLSKIEIKVTENEAPLNMLIPLKGVQELRRLSDEALASDAEASLKLVRSGPNAFFTAAGFRFSVKLVEAQFPPYEQVIPEASSRVVRAPRALVCDALRAVSLAASDRTGGVKLTLSGGSLRFESESPESGEGFDEVAVDYDGEEVTVGFNARYFLDAALAIESEELLLGISGELDPAVIRPSSDTASVDYLAVVMPMRI
jgi:DNA polymerase-3 subunit beta